MSRRSLTLLAIALTLLLVFLLATFERAAMPRPDGGSAPSPETPAAHADGRESAPDTTAPVDSTAAGTMEPAGVEVRDDGLVATWFAPAPTSEPGPALLVLGGSEGGKEMSTRMAAALHARGYATLALAYFGDEGLPEQLLEIPLEYFGHALDWLARQPGVDPMRIGVVGGSKGAEAALLLASRDQRVRAVLASTPSDFAWQSVDWNGWSDTPSWTERGQPVPYLRYAPFDPAEGLRAMYDRSIAEASEEARERARIPIENSAAAILLIAGGEDALWGAVEASDRMAAALDAAGHPHEVLVLRYPEAGHVVFIGRPLVADDPLIERILPMGGTPDGVLAAINDSWPKALAFLERSLAKPATTGSVGVSPAP